MFSFEGDTSELASVVEVIETSRRFAEARGEGATLTFSEYAEALLCNALGRYEAAAVVAERAFGTEQIAFGKWICPELIEASARSGRGDLAREGFEWISERTQASGTDWGLGVAARCRALLAEGQEAEDSYEEAVQRLDRTRMKTDLARAHLLYGEWLRRQRRRADAREHLGIAHEMFSLMEALAFADRAARELGATGATARKRSPETQQQLTPQEARIAQLASEGMTNPQIATELFISARTVEYHLHKVFTKLGIESRGRLAKALVETASGFISM